MNRQLEARVIEHADRVVFTTPETVDLVMAKYPALWRKKVRVIPHGYNPIPPSQAGEGREGR